MRKLPVYLVLDTSGSMLGEPIESVKNGIQILISTLRQDPYALETVFLSIITFNHDAQQIIPLTELSTFAPPQLSAGGETSLGAALALLANRITTEVTVTTYEKKGDWRPLVFIMTDGVPTDEWENGLLDLKKVKTGLIVACAAGANADINILQQITETVVCLDATDPTTIKSFFKWVSDSIATGSKKMEKSSSEMTSFDDLPQPPEEIKLIH